MRLEIFQLLIWFLTMAFLWLYIVQGNHHLRKMNICVPKQIISNNLAETWPQTYKIEINLFDPTLLNNFLIVWSQRKIAVKTITVGIA